MDYIVQSKLPNQLGLVGTSWASMGPTTVQLGMMLSNSCTEPYKNHIVQHEMLGQPQAPGQDSVRFWLLGTCCLPPLCCQLDLGIDWPVNPLIQVDSNHCLKKTCEHTANMCRIVSPVGMLCHLGAWGMASESGKHDNMAVSKLSKLFGLMHKTVVWGVQVDKPQTIACPHRNKL